MVENAISAKESVEGPSVIAHRAEKLATKWPFWRTVPRFDREYTFGDLALALWSLPTRTDPAGFNWSLLPNVPAYFTRSGRECLYAALRVLKLRPHSRVGVPLFCCGTVFEAIAAAGHVPVFLDINLDTYTLDEAFLHSKRGEVDALVVVHTFGYPADLDGIRNSLGCRVVPIIEDCAHALLSEYKSKMIGNCTELSFFSFGIHKPAAVGGGGVLIVNDPKLAPAAEHECLELGGESKWGELRHALICWARGVAYQRSVYGAVLASPLGRFRDRDGVGVERIKNGALKESWSLARMRSVDWVLVESRVRDFQNRASILAQNTQVLRNLLEQSPLKIPDEPPWGRWNHFSVPIRYPSSRQRELGRQFLTSQRVDTSPLWRNCVRDAYGFGYRGGCPNSEEASKTVCTIPNHAWLSDDDLRYIGRSLRRSSA